MKIKFSISATDVAKYFYLRAIQDGELISPLKMQKLVYFAYVEYIKKTKDRLFSDRIEAWPMGPVIVNLYQALKQFGSLPIDDSFLGFKSEKKVEGFLEKFGQKMKRIIDGVYEKYIIMSAFELVTISHAHKPWLLAREGLSATEKSDKEIEDKDILKYDC